MSLLFYFSSLYSTSTAPETEYTTVSVSVPCDGFSHFFAKFLQEKDLLYDFFFYYTKLCIFQLEFNK